MKRIGVFSAIALGLIWVHAFAFAEPATEQQALVKAGIENLLASVDTYSASEKPRLGKAEDGSLCFFGAPPNAHAKVDAALKSAKPEDKALGFLRQHAAAFGAYSSKVDFKVERTGSEKDRSFVRMGQTYAGLPVFAAEVVVQLDDSEGVAAVFSDLIRNVDRLDAQRVSLSPALTAEQAEAIALSHEADSYEARARDKDGTLRVPQEDIRAFRDDLTVQPTTTLMVCDPSVVGSNGDVCAVWKVVVTGVMNPLEKEVVLVNASSGEIALKYPLVNSALAREIRDQQNTRLLAPYGLLAREEGDPVTGIADVDTIYDIYGDVYEFYQDENGRDSIDNQGAMLQAVVRMCPFVFSEACWWLCPCPNAFWDGERMFFGEGMISDDVVGHELTHGVTQSESGLVYLNQSGAINESFSDVWGEFIDLTNASGNDSSEVRWRIGEDLPIGVQRSMKSPPDFGDPDRMGSTLYYVGTDDGGGVHTNSGVNNKLTYLLTDGDTFNNRTVAGMGIPLIVDLYYECQTHLLSSGADYRMLYFALEQAAVNLGLTETQRENIDQACRAVEIRPTAFFTLQCANGGALVRFTDDGDVIVQRGNVITSSAISPNSSTAEVIIKKGQSDYLALLDSITGNFYLSGRLYEGISLPGIPNGSLIIKNSEGPVAFINSVAFVSVSLEPQSPSIVPAGSLILAGDAISLGY